LVLPWRARQAGSDAVEVLTRIAISDHICRRLWLAGNDEQGEDHRADDAKLKKKLSTSAFLLVLGSAVLHASWNLAIKASGDRLVTAAGQVVLGALAFTPALVVTGLPHGAWGWVALSSVVHLLYGLSLVAAYERGDLSAMYPIARGTAPALVAIGAAVLLGDSITLAGVVAIGLIVGGIVAIGLTGRPRGVPWAILTGIFITTYTIIDGRAVRALDTAVAYTVFVFLGNAVLYAALLVWRRGITDIVAAVRIEWWKQALGGSASLVLTAARTSPLGLVSAVRETSVVFGAIAGWLLLHEQLGSKRVIAASSIAAGLAVIALQ
jgi:drug/metabolite transporter (DMT)-like permease